ncbi:hypothetical protein [Aminobacter sp. MET-1]|uniref:hypothetical protein n=1 Tax=Aminobacter sp. MET-1 TaxID=2951085 RepID=UPI00226984AF|nr:hypothetical protein [Aminobacter sp. MET-1]MCX8571076.1 hypothetical protein [Aminobacter sp. MET-1]MCX8573255.1 hypothetical protein [Aminobacter sp. MET-1]
MRTFLPDRIRLRHMETACRQNCEHLRIIDRQILKQAERLTINDRPKVRQYGRHATTWTPADERHYQTCVDAVFEARRPEIDALRRKIDRQRTAIELLRLRLRINEPSPDFDIIMISG